MKKDSRFVAGLTCGVALGATVTAAIAQGIMFDPAIVAPHIYETTLENERVRVLKKTTRNGETPPLHSHPDSVVVYLTSCAWMQEDDEGRTAMESYGAGDVVWTGRMTHGGETSKVVHDCLLLQIELKE